jgi:hypothetical protein
MLRSMPRGRSRVQGTGRLEWLGKAEFFGDPAEDALLVFGFESLDGFDDGAHGFEIVCGFTHQIRS